MTAQPADKDKFKELQAKILLARDGGDSEKLVQSEHKNMHYVWRMVLELVIGMIMGFGIGYGLDHWLGTTPIMIIVMSLFGFGAGIRSMMRTADELTLREYKGKK